MKKKKVKTEIFRTGNYVKTTEYNKQGKPIYSIDSDGDEEFYEYDENGNCIKYTSVDGESIYKYDKYGNLIYSKENDGIERFFEYKYY